MTGVTVCGKVTPVILHGVVSPDMLTLPRSSVLGGLMCSERKHGLFAEPGPVPA